MAQSRVRSPSYVTRKRHSGQDYDSPSKQLFRDLERALDQIQLHEVEEHKVRAYERRSFYGYLDQLDQERARVDVAALDAATARHNAVRKEAENELNAYYRQLEEEERKRREEEERKERERLAREKAERERREREEAAKREAERKAQEEAERKAAEAKAKAEVEERARKEREETAAREKAEKEQQEKVAAEKKATEEREKKEAEERAKAAAEQPAPVSVSAPPAAGATALTSELEALHNRYLDIHRKLKEFRRTFWEECKKNKEIKTKVGELRRSIRASVGQLVEPTAENPRANSIPTSTIRDALVEALNLPVPPVSLNDFIPVPDTSSNLLPASSALIYCLSIFSKAIISQFSNESGVNTKAAEPAGILTATIFAQPNFQPAPNVSLISILLAKFHAVCPVLFGIFPGGNNAENTAAGKQRLGWRREDNTFVTANRHYERVTGLGAGFAAVSLRNFSNSRNRSPCPPSVYWECLSNILNTPPDQVVPTHLLVLKGMIENSADRFVMFYSTAALAALRRATSDFPHSLPDQVRKSPACNSLVLLPETLKRDKNIDFL